MNNSTSPTPHFCTNNCKSPIRAARPQNPIHPYLHEVNVRHIDFNSCGGAVEFDKYYLQNTAGSETRTPSPSAIVAENSQITSESDNPPAPVRAAARECKCHPLTLVYQRGNSSTDLDKPFWTCAQCGGAR